MPLLIALGSLLFLIVVFGPQLWVRYVLKAHGIDRPDLPGTGAELARHLLDEAGLQQVAVEETDIYRRPLRSRCARGAAPAPASRRTLDHGRGGGGA
jgi:hypothetical protein